MEEITIRLLRDDDIRQVNDLYKKAYHIDRSNEKFRWEFLSGPAGPSIYVVAVDSKTGKIVGTQCAIPLYVTSASGTRTLTAKSEDTLVDPDYRGKSIFERMYDLLFAECRKAGIEAIWGFTYAVKPFRKIGFDIPFSCAFGLTVFDIGGAYNYFSSLKEKRTFTEKLKIAALVFASRLKYVINISSSSIDGYTISNEVQANLENLSPSQASAFYLHHDSAFLDWRLRRNPYPNEHLYYSLIDKGGNRRAAVVCTRMKEVSYIMYMGFAEGLPEPTKKKFVGAVTRDMSQKTDVLRFWGFVHNETGREEIALLKTSGFIFTNQGISFVWKKLIDTSTLNATDFVLSRMASQGT